MKQIAILALACASSTVLADFTQLNLSAAANIDATTDLTGGADYPAGGSAFTIGGINFNAASFMGTTDTGIVAGVDSIFGGNLIQTTDIDVSSQNVNNATDLFTVFNSAFGENGVQIATVAFKGKNGSFAQFNLTEGDNVRDHYNGFYNNDAPNIYATASFLNGSVVDPSQSNDRLDVQHFVLPTAFQSDQLTDIVITATGDSTLNFNGGYSLLFAATAQTQPVPEPLSLGVLALGSAALLRKRRAR